MEENCNIRLCNKKSNTVSFTLNTNFHTGKVSQKKDKMYALQMADGVMIMIMQPLKARW